MPAISESRIFGKLPITNLPSILSAPYRHNRGGKVNEAIEGSIGPLLPDLNKKIHLSSPFKFSFRVDTPVPFLLTPPHPASPPSPVQYLTSPNSFLLSYVSFIHTPGPFSTHSHARDSAASSSNTHTTSTLSLLPTSLPHPPPPSFPSPPQKGKRPAASASAPTHSH